MTRGSAPTNPSHPRFRCRICQEFVIGTEAGFCPRCGEPPPRIEVLPREPSRSMLAMLIVVAIGAIVVLLLTRN